MVLGKVISSEGYTFGQNGLFQWFSGHFSLLAYTNMALTHLLQAKRFQYSWFSTISIVYCIF